MLREAHSRRRNSSGIWSRIPPPSPVSGSPPLAPRWSRLQRTSSPSSTVPRVRRPSTRATNPTPQEACSRAGLKRPGLVILDIILQACSTPPPQLSLTPSSLLRDQGPPNLLAKVSLRVVPGGQGIDERQ